MPFLVGFFVEAEALPAVGFVGYDGGRATLFQPLAQLVAVIGLIPHQLLCGSGSADETAGERVVVRLATAQEDGKRTAFSICKCVDLRVAPAAARPDRLFLLPPFPPAAERCALMCVESTIYASLDRPRSARARNNLSQTPRSAQRTKRL